MKIIDYYEVLEIDRDADQRRIKEAYRKLALRYHPDRNKDDPVAAERMKILNEAYAVLSDPGKREQYDRLRSRYGDDAYSRFRQSYSEQDIFSESDIYSIFEEMARSFGLRGFDEIFKDFYGQSFKVYTFGGHGGGPAGAAHGKTFGRQAQPSVAGRLVSGLARKAFYRMTGVELPRDGRDICQVLYLDRDWARQGGPFPYHHRLRDKKLVVKIPPGIKEGQIIRLAGMGHPGSGGGRDGDLLLRVRFKRSAWQRIKSWFGKGPKA